MYAAFEKERQTGWIIVLEDLDSAGFELRKQQVTRAEISACLDWLASFHATFMTREPENLWPVGTYWHLDTRPEEFEVMPSGPLKDVASLIDLKLKYAKFQTIVHGDAKLANFCFGKNHRGKPKVAAVDFQYVGSGCGMKDVAYLISSCLDESESEKQHDDLLNYYFEALSRELEFHQPDINFSSLKQEWYDLYPFAWADFCRFLSGWSPGHWKLNRFSDRLTKAVVDQLSNPRNQ